jgi:hypothetical protein
MRDEATIFAAAQEVAAIVCNYPRHERKTILDMAKTLTDYRGAASYLEEMATIPPLSYKRTDQPQENK